MKKGVLEFSVELVNEKHLSKIEEFKCGNNEIDAYLKKKAFADLQSGDGVTKIVLDTLNNKIMAYYTLCCSSIVINKYDKKYYSPAIEVKMFALNEEYQKLKINYYEDYEDYVSDLIFTTVIKEVNEFTSNTCGAKNVILYSTDNAKHFYRRNLFECFEPFMEKNDDRYLIGCTPMFFTL